MNALIIKTPSEQRLEWLESLKRPLTSRESEELRRALHAVYARDRNLERARKIEAEWADAILNEHAEHERETLRRMTEESRAARREALRGKSA